MTDLETLAAAYYGYVLRLALSILDDPQEAQDAAQETFLCVQRRLAGFRGEAQPKTWLTAIAVNVCRARLRRRGVLQRLQAALTGLQALRSPHQEPERLAIEDEQRRAVWGAVAGLDEKHRLVVILRYVHELSVKEIAESLRIKEGTVHSRLHYARRVLRQQLAETSVTLEVLDGTP